MASSTSHWHLQDNNNNNHNNKNKTTKKELFEKWQCFSVLYGNDTLSSRSIVLMLLKSLTSVSCLSAAPSNWAVQHDDYM